MAQSARIYLDNAATSWPKPPQVYEAVDHYQREVGAPAGRCTYREAAEVERQIDKARSNVAKLIGASEPSRIIFTHNGTDSLNLAIHGLVRPGDHVVTTVCEHNSVLRPLAWWREQGDVEVAYVDCDENGCVSVEAVLAALQPHTRLVALVHASNVTGAIQPVAQIGAKLREHPALLLIDAAQTLGHVPIDVTGLGADLLAAPGHKGLLGPLGTGVLFVRPGVEQQLRCTRQGGTGSQSDRDQQPDRLPDKYESGNLNVAGLVGLAAATEFLHARTVAGIADHEQSLIGRLLTGFSQLSNVRVLGPSSVEDRAGVVSLVLDGYDPQEVAAILDATARIQVRAGLHCAPRMHEALGTTAIGGVVRFSVGFATTEQQIDATVHAVAELANT